jgi:micrococcal nuclease
MRALDEGRRVRCVQVGGGTPCDGRSRPTSGNRTVAQCFVGDLDIAAEMIRGGHACDWPKFSGGYYSLDRSTCINPN